jgi:inner membrane protein
MLIFAHTGITLGAAAIAAEVIHNGKLIPESKTSWFTSLSSYLDIRVLLIGSILPDLIDKPIGLYFFRESIGNGRTYAHTLLFLVLITVAGLLVYRFQHRNWMLVLAAGTLTHLILDATWQNPKTLFWPVMGTEFERIQVSGWFNGILDGLTSPMTYVPEFVGFAIILWFSLMLVFKKQTTDFIRCGRVQ